MTIVLPLCAQLSPVAFASIAKRICAGGKRGSGNEDDAPYSEVKMAGAPDYEFRLGKERHLKGRGWRGLLALAFLLTPLVVAAHHSLAWFRAILHSMK